MATSDEEIGTSDLSSIVEDGYFDGDPPALKNNEDYQKLLKYKLTLHIQYHTAVRRKEALKTMVNAAQKDPKNLIQLVEAGELDLPVSVAVCDMPEVNWCKYDVDTSADSDSFRHRRTRASAQKTPSPISSITSSCSRVTTSSSKRVPTSSSNRVKPEISSRMWTPEEQRQLDVLMEKYVEEPVAVNRYRKIAAELVTRTPIQVQSRVQKYKTAIKRRRSQSGGSTQQRRRTRKPRSSFFPGTQSKSESSATVEEVNESSATVEEVNVSSATLAEVNQSSASVEELNQISASVEDVNQSSAGVEAVNVSSATVEEVNESSIAVMSAEEVTESCATVMVADEVKTELPPQVFSDSEEEYELPSL